MHQGLNGGCREFFRLFRGILTFAEAGTPAPRNIMFGKFLAEIRRIDVQRIFLLAHPAGFSLKPEGDAETAAFIVNESIKGNPAFRPKI